VKRLILGCVVLLALWSAPPTHAAIILNDSFDYTNGPLVTVSGTNWTTHNGTAGQVQVFAGRALLAQTNSEDVSASLGQSYPATTDIALYVSFTINFSRMPVGNGDYFAHFKGSGTGGFRDRIFATSNGVPTGFFRVGLANADSAPSVLISSNLSLNTDYLLITRYIISNASSTLWLNPSAETDPSVTATDTTTASAESAFALREGADIGILYFDNLIIGTNLGDVLPNTPPSIVLPPQSQTVTEGSNVTFTVTASGAPPLSYQWQFNGTNQDGATTSILTLPGVTTNQAGDYTVMVTNAFGCTNSTAATLTVNPAPPLIMTSPASQTVVEGADVAFTVVAAGTQPLSYQWQFNGTNLAGATGTLLSLTNVTVAQAGSYIAVVTNAAGSTNSQPATLTVNVIPPAAAALSVLTYNVHGSAVTNWSTNSLQVQAVGRQMQFLQPDIITFQEIPMSLAYEMTNFAAAYLPGYFLSNSPTADGWTRSSIASRFPIARATSWLRQADLAPFGYTNDSNFTLDLFEAHISVPGFEQPLHVFTAHLKSGTSSDALAKRNAEAAAVSNYFVTAFLTTNASHPYVLTGDLNETDTNQLSIQRLTSAPVGLQLTTPINPYTGSSLTFSIQSTGGLTKRFDYILPGAMLFTNITGSQIFRTDLLTNPPPPLLAEDDQIASDHLPVIMYFNNPFGRPFRLLAFSLTNQDVTLKWESTSGRRYHVEASSNLTAWATLVSNLTAYGTNCTFTTNATEALKFFRIYRLP
jgi:endonuclease/exonuclease/phosphatase family metal-dependent hydrolase